MLSNEYKITPVDAGKQLEIGTNRWVFFDYIGLGSTIFLIFLIKSFIFRTYLSIDFRKISQVIKKA